MGNRPCVTVCPYFVVKLSFNLLVRGPLQETGLPIRSCLPEAEQIQKVKKKLCAFGFFLGGKFSTIENL